MKHVNVEQRFVLQDAREVETKFGKTISTYVFPVSEEALKVVAAWIIELRTDHLWGADDPVFPATRIAPGENALFKAEGLARRHWSNAGPVRRIFQAAFERAGLPYFNPHSFRNTLARLGQKRCRSPEEMKAWSQNLGHEQMMTTFASHGRLETHRQGEIIRALATRTAPDDSLRDLLQQFLTRRQLTPPPHDAIVQELPTQRVKGAITAAYLVTPFIPALAANFRDTPMPSRLFHPAYRRTFRFGAIVMRPGMPLAQVEAAIGDLVKDAGL